jgi:hypothetical protein
VITRRELLELAGGAVVAALLPGTAARAGDPGPPVAGEWLAGDFHCHTTYSHDVWAGPGQADPGDPQATLSDSFTWGWTAAQQIAIAEARALHFLAITDHDRVDALADPGYRSDRLTLVPGYEHSLAGGHVGVFTPAIDGLPDIVRDTDGSKGFVDDAALRRFLAQIGERDGVAVLNHPYYGGKGSLAWRYSIEASLGFDAVEVWNINWLARHDVIPFLDSDNHQSLPWWESNFVARKRVAAVGGSDNPWRATTELQGVGQPTTWVHAADRSPAAILAGVRAGRTFISAQPPSRLGPEVHLSAVEEVRGGRTAMVGGTVRPNTPLTAHVAVRHGGGQRLRLVANGEIVDERVILRPDTSVEVPVALPRGGWLRAELFADPGYAMTSLTSPIYAAGRPHRTGATVEPSVGRPATYHDPAAAARLLPILESR